MFLFCFVCMASLVAQLVQNPPALWETWVGSLGWENPLEKGKATHFPCIFPVFWPGEFHGLYSPWGRKEVDTTEQLSLHFTSLPGGSMVKHLPAMPETWVPPLGWEDPLEIQMATYSSILAWEIPWTEEPGKLNEINTYRK